jgi:RHS repeat-associated protein
VFATNSSGVKTWTAAYLPFGGVRVTTGTPPTARFPGQWFQSETGLHQNWMRDYDPTTGRYMQADPLGLVNGASVYGYARQSPGRYVDPSGEFIPLAILAGAAIGIGADLLYQLWANDGRFECVNWGKVGLSGALGAFGGGYYNALKYGLVRTGGMRWANVSRLFKQSQGYASDYISHHGVVRALTGHPSGWRNGWWNLRAVTRPIHNGLHGMFGAPQLGTFGRWIYGTPTWLLGAEASAGIGGLTEMLDSECGCTN